ncbi:hypothetical protein ACH50O_00595 [Methylomonas sp. 2BW1-5-20]|uniref:hypothetical protein n=1 Tax=Methylomonas sp. 2BW1-5-20 TaxID=3376686 RepID=UPI0040515BDE
MKFCKPALLLYHLYHQIKAVNYQCINWYRYNLLTYTIAIPPIPKTRKTAARWGSGLKPIPLFLAPVPHLKATPAVGLRDSGIGGMAKIAFFFFFYFVGVFRRSFPYLAIERGAREATL